MARVFTVCFLMLAFVADGWSDDGLAERLEAAEQRYRSEGPEPVLQEFEALLSAAESAGEAPVAAAVRRLIGECHWLMGNFEVARSTLEKALDNARALDDSALEAKTLNVLGLLAWDQGDYPAATARFEAAAVLAERLGDPKMQGAILNNRSLVLDEIGDYRTSLDQYRQVLDLYAQVDFPRGEGDTLGNIGGVNLLLGRYREAIEHYTRALAISETLESVQAMSQDHGNLGFAHAGLGNTQLALRHFEQALELARQAGLAQEEAYWLRGKANAEIAAGRYDLGLAHHRAALEGFRRSGAEGPLLDALHDMGRLMLEMGDPSSAEQYFEQALKQAAALERTRSISLNEIALGDLQRRHQFFEAAVSHFQKALSRARKSGEVDLEVQALLALAAMELDRDQPDQALAQAQSALSVAMREGMHNDQAAAWLVYAEARLANDEPAEALQASSEALDLIDPAGDVDLAWQAELARARSLAALDQPNKAIAGLETAVALIESVRSRLREKRFRSGYLQDKHQVYTLLVRLQLEAGRQRDAFETAERLRRYGSHDSVVPVSSLEEPRTVELQARIRQLQRAIDEEVGAPRPAQRQLALDTFSSELIAAEREFQALLDDQAASAASAVVVADSDATRARLGSNEALIQYVVGGENVMMFVLTPQALHTQIMPLERATLRSRIELLRDLLLEHDSARWTRPAKRLAETLMHPALEAGWLTGAQRLFLVPHGVLNYLPFAVLPDSGEGAAEALVKHFDIAYLPSASVLISQAENSPHERVLTVSTARSRLQFAPEEARTIAKLFEPRSHQLQGVAATETAFRALAGEYSVLHLATHGYFKPLNPLLSGLELEADADHDGLLEVHEIQGLNLQADLVTLSACRTGLGSGYFTEYPAGDDLISLTRAFLQAGSAAVLATLWEVDDRSTVGLMTDFYTRLEEAGAHGDKAVALARAQRALRESVDYHHPYYWAPFILVGASEAPPEVNRS